jgi:hypothetical protein
MLADQGTPAGKVSPIDRRQRTLRPLYGRMVRTVICMLLVSHAVLLTYAGLAKSPTLNEPATLIAGLSILKYRQFGVYPVNPPLPRVVAAFPVVLGRAKTDWRSFVDTPAMRQEFRLGEDFVAANGERSVWLFTLARWACIPFSLLGGVISYLWGRDLYGRGGGLLALTLWCFCPNILGHGAPTKRGEVYTPSGAGCASPPGDERSLAGSCWDSPN